MSPLHLRIICMALAGAASLTIVAAQPVAAQRTINAHSPALPNSAQRRAILDALRPAVTARLGPDIEFRVQDIRVRDGWAIVHADPQRRGGGRIDGSRIFANWDDMDGLQVTALLKFEGGRWMLVEHEIGATNRWYCVRRIAAPRALTYC